MASSARRLGVVGAGNIGGAIAANLLADGYAVVVHAADPARSAALVAAGAVHAVTPAAVAERAEITFPSLPAATVMEAVADAWLSGAARDAVLVDLSTNSPATIRSVGERLAAAGRHLLEAPLTGGAPGAQARMLVFMVGGERSVYERCLPVLQRLGRAVFHMGPLGSGNVAKLVNSLLAFTATWSSLEGLAVAAKAGINLRTMIEVIRAGGAGNFFTDRMVEGINERGRPTQFALALAAKDAGLLLEVAREAGVPVPVAAEVAQALGAAGGAGLRGGGLTGLGGAVARGAGAGAPLPPARTS